MSYMQDVPVRNKDLLTRLDRYKDLLTRDVDNFKRVFHASCSEHKSQRDYWTGLRHLEEIKSQRTAHEGFPDTMYGYELSTHRKNHEFFSNRATPMERKDLTAELAFMNEDLISWLGVRHNALTAYYPPGGFISWHNNANAPAYNLIFTWSEDSRGHFDYVDPTTKEVVKMQDKVGWQCKAAYFGHYEEPERLFYHSASTDCWRCTVSFTLNTSELSAEVREDLIEEISSEE
jgi:hypothetical protein